MKIDTAINTLGKKSDMPCLAFDTVRDIYMDIDKAKKDLLRQMQSKSNENGTVDLGDVASILDNVFQKRFGTK